MNRNRVIWTTLTTLNVIIGAVVGYVIASNYSGVEIDAFGHLHLPGTLKPKGDLLVPRTSQPALYIVLPLGFAVIFFRLASWLADHAVSAVSRLRNMTWLDRVLAVGGTLVGLIIGVLITVPLANLTSEQSSWLVVQFGVIVVCAGIGLGMMTSMRGEMVRVFPHLEAKQQEAELFRGMPKLLDTNIIIDGRIAELCKTGFLEGPLFVPNFVLDEVQFFADSADASRRTKGRRGLEVLNQTSKIKMIATSGADAVQPLLRVCNDIPAHVAAVKTVDGRLVALAKEMGAAIVTNDFNLKSVAELQGVRVLSLNELSASLRPAVLAGEEMSLLIVKEGSHPGQGVGYLEDGTMIVVGDGAAHIGENCRVVIDRIVQTVTGKMIFAYLRDKGENGDEPFGPGGNGNGGNGNGGTGNGGNGNGKKRR